MTTGNDNVVRINKITLSSSNPASTNFNNKGINDYDDIDYSNNNPLLGVPQSESNNAHVLTTDGKVDMKDVLSLRKWLSGQEGGEGIDIDGDGKVGMKDLLTMRKMLAGKPILDIDGDGKISKDEENFHDVCIQNGMTDSEFNEMVIIGLSEGKTFTTISNEYKSSVLSNRIDKCAEWSYSELNGIVSGIEGIQIDKDTNTITYAGKTIVLYGTDSDKLKKYLITTLSAYNQMPQFLKDKTTTIKVYDFNNPGSPYALATAGGGNISVYESGAQLDDLYGVLLHESGHNLDSSFGWFSKENNDEFSQTGKIDENLNNIWNAAILADAKNHPGDEISVTKDNDKIHEDFAQSVRLYLTNTTTEYEDAKDSSFYGNYPNRTKVLKFFVNNINTIDEVYNTIESAGFKIDKNDILNYMFDKQFSEPDSDGFSFSYDLETSNPKAYNIIEYYKYPQQFKDSHQDCIGIIEYLDNSELFEKGDILNDNSITKNDIINYITNPEEYSNKNQSKAWILDYAKNPEQYRVDHQGFSGLIDYLENSGLHQKGNILNDNLVKTEDIFNYIVDPVGYASENQKKSWVLDYAKDPEQYRVDHPDCINLIDYLEDPNNCNVIDKYLLYGITTEDFFKYINDRENFEKTSFDNFRVISYTADPEGTKANHPEWGKFLGY